MRIILNSTDEKNDRFFLNPIVDRPFSKLRCSKVSLPNTVTVAHPDEDLRFTTKHGTTTKSYVISLQDINSSDGNFWEDRLNERIRQQGIGDWVWYYDDNVGKFGINFTQNGTDSITFTNDCRILGIVKGDVITHVTYQGGKLEISQEVKMSYPSTENFVVAVYDSSNALKFYISNNNIKLVGKGTTKATATEIVNVLNSSYTNITSTSGGAPWPVTWTVTAGAGDVVNYTLNWAAPPPGLSGAYEVAYYYTNANDYPEKSETGLTELRSLQNTATGGGSIAQTGTVAYNTTQIQVWSAVYSNYKKTLTIPTAEHTPSEMATLFNNLGIDGLTASATGANQYTLSYTPRTTATGTQYITGNVNIWPDTTTAGFTENFAINLSGTPAPSTVVITLPNNPSRPETFVSNVVNLVPYNHAYITCSISTEDCNASVGNDAVIAEVPHAGAFMERHHYESNSPYFLPITQKDALSSIEIGIIDDRGRDLKSRLRGAPYLVVLELE